MWSMKGECRGKIRSTPTPSETFTNGHGSAHGAAVHTDHVALEHLDTFLFTFDDTEVHFHGVAGLESGNIKAHLFAFRSFR